jgi:hypothetical protein
VVLVLSKDFIEKFYPMEELKLAYERHMAEGDAHVTTLVPVYFMDITPGDVKARIRAYQAAAHGIRPGEVFQPQPKTALVGEVLATIMGRDAEGSVVSAEEAEQVQRWFGAFDRLANLTGKLVRVGSRTVLVELLWWCHGQEMAS